MTATDLGDSLLVPLRSNAPRTIAILRFWRKRQLEVYMQTGAT